MAIFAGFGPLSSALDAPLSAICGDLVDMGAIPGPSMLITSSATRSASCSKGSSRTPPSSLDRIGRTSFGVGNGDGGCRPPIPSRGKRDMAPKSQAQDAPAPAIIVAVTGAVRESLGPWFATLAMFTFCFVTCGANMFLLLATLDDICRIGCWRLKHRLLGRNAGPQLI